VKAEAILFVGVAVFFAISGAIYAAFSTDPAGNAALIISVLMASLIAFFLWMQYRRRGARLQDTKSARIEEAAGPLAFFPPSSHYPVVAALGTALTGLGVIFGLWLFLIGLAVTVHGVMGFVFQYERHPSGEG
jgi:ABC-type Fe3+ transport system permease subunit